MAFQEQCSVLPELLVLRTEKHKAGKRQDGDDSLERGHQRLEKRPLHESHDRRFIEQQNRAGLKLRLRKLAKDFEKCAYSDGVYVFGKSGAGHEKTHQRRIIVPDIGDPQEERPKSIIL